MAYNISSSINVVCLLLALVVTTNSQNYTCPFDYILYVGDGVFDAGNAIRRMPYGPTLPAARFPYGITFPGQPIGRWSDGLLTQDIGAPILGFPQATPSLSRNGFPATSFATAGSPVLNRSFFRNRSILVPSYIASLRTQIKWLRNSPDYLHRVANSIFIFGDIEANDITYALLQGKSIQEAASYITRITRVQINAVREVIGLGATRIVVPGNAPVGCYPFVLTSLASRNLSDYDDLGCLKSVNDLIVLKNNDLQRVVQNITIEYPYVSIAYMDFYGPELSIIREIADDYGSIALQACCGTGGRYNFDNRRFCGSPGVPVCSTPDKYFFWDGIHLTQGANGRLVDLIFPVILPVTGCIPT